MTQQHVYDQEKKMIREWIKDLPNFRDAVNLACDYLNKMQIRGIIAPECYFLDTELGGIGLIWDTGDRLVELNIANNKAVWYEVYEFKNPEKREVETYTRRNIEDLDEKFFKEVSNIA